MQRRSFLAVMGLLGVRRAVSAGVGDTMSGLRVSADGHSLIHADGRPFFWLADTAWELFHRLDRDEADAYLRKRAEQGFNVVQAVALAEFAGLVEPNRYGHLPLDHTDPTKPIDAYFEHVDWVVDRAAELGIWTGFLPTWGDKWNKKWGQGPEIFTPENARAYGEWLGQRYRDKPIVWILGGDRPPEYEAHYAITRAMAEGLEAGDGGAHLKTFHPSGGRGSAQFFHAEAWLDFNMRQSGHGAPCIDNGSQIASDYAKQPPKPCVDGEPRYEDHPINWKPDQGWFDEHDVRKAAYAAVFAGAMGHTYGCHDIWQFLSERHQPVSSGRTPWTTAIDFPGAWQMGHLRRLMESLPYLTRIPDQSLLVKAEGEGCNRVWATRDGEGSYALVYLPLGQPVTVDLKPLVDQVVVTWFDPRTGERTAAGEIDGGQVHEFAAPSSGEGHDWVLLLQHGA